MKRIAYILLLVLFFESWFPSTNFSLAQSPHVPIIDSALQRRLNTQASQDQISVIVMLSEQADIKSIGGKDRGERLRNVISKLQNTADRTQVNLRGLLMRALKSGDVHTYTPLWIINAIALTANANAINALARQPEVAAIVLDQTIPGRHFF